MTIDKDDKTREPQRNIIIEFFKKSLGFKEEDIILIDRTEFDFNEDGELQPNFSAETFEAIKNFAIPIF